MNCTERSFVSEAVSGSYIRTSCSSTQQNPEPWPCHTRSWCIFQCETETWCVVQHTQSKSCPDHHAYQKSYIGLYVLQRSQWMMILHPCQRKKTHSGWLPCGRGRSRFQVTSDGSRLMVIICVRRSSARSLAALGILRELTVSKAAEIPGRTLQKATKTVE